MADQARPEPGALVAGHVESFDDHRGLGVVRADTGAALAFHCVAIADGTRTVAVGTRVRARVGAGVLGRWEAVEVVPG